MEDFTHDYNSTSLNKWRDEFNACRIREDYRRYYISYINCENNPFRDLALKKVELFNSYKEELDECSNVKELENYVLKYIESDNPYLQEAKNKIAELSKLSTPRWGIYRIISGVCCLVIALILVFLLLELDGTSNNILALIGILSLCGMILFTIGGIWLILRGIKILRNFLIQ